MSGPLVRSTGRAELATPGLPALPGGGVAGLGQAQQQLGASIQRASQELGSIAIRMRKEDDEREALEKFSDTTARLGVVASEERAKVGSIAFGGADRFAEASNEELKKAQFSTNRARERYDSLVKPWTARELQQVSFSESRQRQVANRLARDDALGSVGLQIATSNGDPATIEDGLAAIASIHMQGVEGPLDDAGMRALEAEIEASQGVAMEALIVEITEDDPARALNLLAEHQDKMRPGRWLKLRETADNFDQIHSAQAWVDVRTQDANGIPLDVDSVDFKDMRDEARLKFTDRGERDAVLGQIASVQNRAINEKRLATSENNVRVTGEIQALFDDRRNTSDWFEQAHAKLGGFGTSALPSKRAWLNDLRKNNGIDTDMTRYREILRESNVDRIAFANRDLTEEVRNIDPTRLTELQRLQVKNASGKTLRDQTIMRTVDRLYKEVDLFKRTRGKKRTTDEKDRERRMDDLLYDAAVELSDTLGVDATEEQYRDVMIPLLKRVAVVEPGAIFTSLTSTKSRRGIGPVGERLTSFQLPVEVVMRGDFTINDLSPHDMGVGFLTGETIRFRDVVHNNETFNAWTTFRERQIEGLLQQAANKSNTISVGADDEAKMLRGFATIETAIAMQEPGDSTGIFDPSSPQATRILNEKQRRRPGGGISVSP